MAETTLFPSITPDDTAEDGDDVIDDLLAGEPDTATPTELRNADACPFCDDYDDDHVYQHAASAHADRVADPDDAEAE